MKTYKITYRNSRGYDQIEAFRFTIVPVDDDIMAIFYDQDEIPIAAISNVGFIVESGKIARFNSKGEAIPTSLEVAKDG
jgi:hypothetical protein